LCKKGFGIACGFTTAGILKCWGTNSSGQLGDGTRTARVSPAPFNQGACTVKNQSGDIQNTVCLCNGITCTFVYSTMRYSTGVGQINYTVTDGTGLFSDSGILNITLQQKIMGCMDTGATNYNSSANIDDGNCTYPGCTDPEAINYSPLANPDDGSCTY
jgi:hypothetical protein